MKNLEEQTISNYQEYSTEMKALERVSNTFTGYAIVFALLIIPVPKQSEGYVVSSSTLKSNHTTHVLHANANSFKYVGEYNTNTNKKIPIDFPIPYNQAIIPTVSEDIRKYFRLHNVENKFRNQPARARKYNPSMDYKHASSLNNHRITPRQSLNGNPYQIEKSSIVLDGKTVLVTRKIPR